MRLSYSEWHDLQHRVTTLETQHKALEAIMSEVTSDQARLDDVAAKEQTATQAIEQEIIGLKAAHPALDFTGLDAALARLQGDATPAPAPAPAPADPGAPPVTPPPAG